MSLGNIGRVLAGQAIESTKKNVMDVLNPAEAAKSQPAPSAENIGAIVLGELQAAQRVLGEHHELKVLFHSQAETIRVLQIFVPAQNVLVLIGTDAEQNPVRVVTPAASAQLIYKTMPVPEGAQAIRVNVLSPRPKSESTPHA